MWTLIPLGNPGPDYERTRHNLGRLLLLRWLEHGGIRPRSLKEFQTGTLYGLSDRLQALVPATYMNLSGQVLTEALAAGLDPTRMIVLVDDKDLPLGCGRFRLAGSDGGHNGLRSLLEALGSDRLARLRLGIGPFTRPLHEFVLAEWSEAEWTSLHRLDRPFEKFLATLVPGEQLENLPGKVNGDAFWGGEDPLDPATPA